MAKPTWNDISKNMHKKCANKELGFLECLSCTDRLKVPLAHPWNKERVFPDVVILTNKKGNTWLVKLEIIKDQVYFKGGWSLFVKDNHLKVGSFVVFEYAGLNVLSFKLFDSKTKCETRGFSPVKSVILEEGEDSTSAFAVPEEDEEVEEGEDSTSAFAVPEEDEEGEGFTSEQQTLGAFPAGEEDEEEDVDSDFEEETINWRGGNTSRIGPDNMPEKKRRTKKDFYANEIFESGVIPRPKSPYFVTRKRACMGDGLYIPVTVVKYYNLQLPTKTVMASSRGPKWETKLKKHKNGGMSYQGGWVSFCRVHGVREGEDCICEFVEEDGEGLTLFLYKLEKIG